MKFPKSQKFLKKNIPPRFENSIILSLEIVSDFGFRASDFIVPLTNIAENLAKTARFSFLVLQSRRLLRISKDLMRRGSVYRPKELLDPSTPAQMLADYYQQLWPTLLAQWSGLLSWDHLFNPRNPLGQWRQMAQELYQISLPLPKEPGRFNHAE